MHISLWKLMVVVAAMGLTACGRNEEIVPVNSSANAGDIETISRARIFFGHQSVGRNLLQGVADLSQPLKSPLRIVPIETADVDVRPGLFHVNVGKNREPLGKIDAFARLVQPSGQLRYDVALLKFCYEDLKSDGSQTPHALVEAYARSVDAIRAAQPQLRLIHVTVPLRADPPGWKTPIKRLLDRPTEEDADNQLRNAFNSELRKRFKGEPLFDIAEVESTLPQGKRSFFMRGGDTVYTLAQAYTTDGGHLNEAGRQQVAAAFVKVVAGVVRKGVDKGER